jgi:hypothetical protein
LRLEALCKLVLVAVVEDSIIHLVTLLVLLVQQTQAAVVVEDKKTHFLTQVVQEL